MKYQPTKCQALAYKMVEEAARNGRATDATQVAFREALLKEDKYGDFNTEGYDVLLQWALEVVRWEVYHGS